MHKCLRIYTFYTVCGVYSGPAIVSLAVCTQKLTRQPAAAPPFIRGQDAIAYNLSPSLLFTAPPLFAVPINLSRSLFQSFETLHSLSLSPTLSFPYHLLTLSLHH